MTEKRFILTINKNGSVIIIDKPNNTIIRDMYKSCEFLNELHEEIEKIANENEQLKKALCCIRKRYDCSIEEFVEDLKDNGIDLTKVGLE